MPNRLKKTREEKGLTQGQLAANSGVSRVTINGLENGKVAVAKTDTLTKIADALGVTVSYLFFILNIQHVEQRKEARTCIFNELLNWRWSRMPASHDLGFPVKFALNQSTEMMYS